MALYTITLNFESITYLIRHFLKINLTVKAVESLTVCTCYVIHFDCFIQ